MRVLIGSSSAALVLERATDRDGSALVEVTTDDGLRASAIVHELPGSGFGGLGLFFESLAEDWRGWSGSRRWSSLEGQLIVDASHEVVRDCASSFVPLTRAPGSRRA